MDVRSVNRALAQGEIRSPGVFPHLDQLADVPYVFKRDFGLNWLPDGPGVLIVRGARQYGKSTWLEEQIFDSVRKGGPGCAFYLNGDELADSDDLGRSIRELLPAFSSRAKTRRLFIDEITSVPHWERVIKRLIDAGELKNVLLVTTGSHAADLRHGLERLPGRRGRLDRTNFLFTPVTYREFKNKCGGRLTDKTMVAYLLSGGSPSALNALAVQGCLPPYLTEGVRDWILGEVARSGRARESLVAVMDVLLSRGGAPIGQYNLAREAGLANNTVAAEYVELLADLLCVGKAYAWDASRQAPLFRKPAKFPFINLLAAASWHKGRVHSIEAFNAMDMTSQGPWWEWLVAQELWRRDAVAGKASPENSAYWRSESGEIDFVRNAESFVEVKRGNVSPLEFSWFPKIVPKGRLLVVGGRAFETDSVRAVTFEDFFLGAETEKI